MMLNDKDKSRLIKELKEVEPRLDFIIGDDGWGGETASLVIYDGPRTVRAIYESPRLEIYFAPGMYTPLTNNDGYLLPQEEAKIINVLKNYGLLDPWEWEQKYFPETWISVRFIFERGNPILEISLSKVFVGGRQEYLLIIYPNRGMALINEHSVTIDRMPQYIKSSVNNRTSQDIAERVILLFKKLQRLGFKVLNGDINIWMDWESELEEVLWTKK